MACKKWCPRVFNGHYNHKRSCNTCLYCKSDTTFGYKQYCCELTNKVLYKENYDERD